MNITHLSEEHHTLCVLSEHGTISTKCRSLTKALNDLVETGYAVASNARGAVWFTISVKGIAALRSLTT